MGCDEICAERRAETRLRAFPPLCGAEARTLILGTFPSPLSREKGEYYGNPRNQFWRILFDVFGIPYDNPDYRQKRLVAVSHRVAVWDVLVSCEAENALDTSIRHPVYNEMLPAFIAEKGIERVWFNGANAYAFYKRGIGEMPRRVLPSTSPANARYTYEVKLTQWRAIKNG